MNRTAAFAAVLLAFSATAHAEDGIATRIATGVGRVIASQGNAALVTIRDEIKDQLAQTLEPFMPIVDDVRKNEGTDPATPPA